MARIATAWFFLFLAVAAIGSGRCSTPAWDLGFKYDKVCMQRCINTCEELNRFFCPVTCYGKCKDKETGTIKPIRPTGKEELTSEPHAGLRKLVTRKLNSGKYILQQINHA